MKICIIVDDNAGYTPEEAKQFGIKVVSMPVIIDGETYFEYKTISHENYYKKMDANADISTSQPAIGEILEMWDETLKEYDQIIHMPMSSGLSASCETAKGLAKDYEGKVFVVDNHRISVTLKSAVNDAKKLIEQGHDGEYIKNYLENTAYESTIYIMVNTLKYLRKGGRVTPAGAVLGEALHIKPVLTILGGKLDAFAKCMGVKKAKRVMIEAIKKDIAEKFPNVPLDQLDFGFAYTEDLDGIKQFIEESKAAIGFKEASNCDPLSLSVATHIGPGALAITVTKVIK